MTALSTSSIPAFKAALKTRLAAVTGLQTYRGDPYPDQPAEERIGIGTARPEDPFRNSPYGPGQQSAALGKLSREERYVVDVVVQVVKAKQHGHEELEVRAYEISALIETSLQVWARENPPFGGLVRMAQVVSTEDWGGDGPQTREARVKLGIGAAARIGI